MKGVLFRNLRIHVLVWLLYIGYEVAVAFSITGEFAAFWSYAYNYFTHILLFYGHAYFAMEYSLARGKRSYLKLILFLVVELGLYMLLKYGFAMFSIYMGMKGGRAYTGLSNFFIETIWRAVNFLGLSTGYWFAMNTIRQRKKIFDLETSQLRLQLEHELVERKLLATENAYLQAQISPHFLFNTLSFIHSSANKLSKDLGNNVMRLSEMMRYAFAPSLKGDKVDLDEEINQVENLIALNKARFNDQMCLNYRVNGDVEGLYIIPLILTTLTENVFKYADLKNERAPAEIDILITNNRIVLKIQNMKRQLVYGRGGHGVGLKNVMLRLEQHYPIAHKLQINNELESFTLHLEIQL